MSEPAYSAFGVYVHWPFCRSKCPYCDFNSHVAAEIDHDRWCRAYAAEIASQAARIAPKPVTSIFFGGGTPSLMQPETVATVLQSIRAALPTSNDLEITLEANPTSVEAGRLRAFRDAGINRVSLGVQSLNNDDLAFLGREHSATEALAAVETAAGIFDRYSFDLIYARPNQSRADWTRELKSALAYAGDHLSLYQLTIEPGTAFEVRHNNGHFQIPDPDSAGDLFEATQDILGEAGLPAYEISNHARPGGESRHNLVYWRYQDYLGIGPGAHGRVTSIDGSRKSTEVARTPADWLDRVERDGHGLVAWQTIDAHEARLEMVMMGLRLREGIPRSRLASTLGQDVEDLFDSAALTALLDAGYLAIDDARIKATAAGRQRLNTVLDHLLNA